MERIKPRARSSGIVVQMHESEVLIYDISRHKAFCLNQMSARIWQACDGTRTIADLTREFGDENVVLLALGDLDANDLLEPAAEPIAALAGATRREVIKKIAVSSVAAVPVILSMVAPAAAQSASCFPVNAACTSNSQCCSLCCRDGTCKPGVGGCAA